MSRPVRLYLDVCCLNRLFDDQTQYRIHLEAEAVRRILGRLESRAWEWLGSEVLDLEIEQGPESERRSWVKLLTTYIDHVVCVRPSEIARARQLQALGFHGMDALPLASVESGDADVFLTTDDRLLGRATRLAAQLRVRVINPLSWIEEVVEE